MVDTFIDEQMEQLAPLHHGCRTDHSPRLGQIPPGEARRLSLRNENFLPGT